MTGQPWTLQCLNKTFKPLTGSIKFSISEIFFLFISSLFTGFTAQELLAKKPTFFALHGN